MAWSETATPISRKFDTHATAFARSFVERIPRTDSDASVEMIAMTTNSSVSVNARLHGLPKILGVFIA